MFECSYYGRTVFCPRIKWSDKDRDNIILFDKALDIEEWIENLHIVKIINQRYKEELTSIIQRYRDCFCTTGACCTILDYEFSIDTGASKPVCCCRPTYETHEKPIIIDNISSLLANNWIEECGVSWGSMIVLAAKPHQEHINNIKQCIWRICVSYRGLNKVTKPFEYHIPRCVDAISIFQVETCQIWIITVNDCQGYNQVCVCKMDRES